MPGLFNVDLTGVVVIVVDVAVVIVVVVGAVVEGVVVVVVLVPQVRPRYPFGHSQILVDLQIPPFSQAGLQYGSKTINRSEFLHLTLIPLFNLQALSRETLNIVFRD